jgi:hypothetical protein
VRDLIVNLAHPRLDQGRFWAVQAMVVGLFVIHGVTVLAPVHRVIPVTNSSIALLLFIPIVYGGAGVGRGGGVGASVAGRGPAAARSGPRRGVGGRVGVAPARGRAG